MSKESVMKNDRTVEISNATNRLFNRAVIDMARAAANEMNASDEVFGDAMNAAHDAINARWPGGRLATELFPNPEGLKYGPDGVDEQAASEVVAAIREVALTAARALYAKQK